MRQKFTLSVVAFFVVATMLACSFSPQAVENPAVPTPVTVLQPVSADLVSQQDALTGIYQQASPGVVSILVTLSDGSGTLGSGWVYNSDGYIVTNQHVVEGAASIEVDFSSGYKTYGTLIGVDPHADLAVVKVDVPAGELHPLVLGDSSTVQVGQIVVAIGNPFGLSGTMTTGIVSAIGRNLPSNSQPTTVGHFSAGDIIQTDASLNPGNSGGPLLNLSGEVIGVNRAIRTEGYTDSGEPVNSGIGFAISINIVKRVVPEIIANGSFDYPYLGISALDDLPLELIDALGLQSYTGAYVTGVVDGGPSDRAGIRVGTTGVSLAGYANLPAGSDLIVAVDGRPIRLFDDLISYLTLYKSPGDEIVLTVERERQQVDVTVTLGTRP
jgi:2-alkenal reductase